MLPTLPLNPGPAQFRGPISSPFECGHRGRTQGFADEVDQQVGTTGPVEGQGDSKFEACYP